MALYAHADIELPTGKVERGADISDVEIRPEDYEYLLDGGAISEEPYDPAADVVPPPEYIEIDGVRYKKESSDA